MNEEIYLDNSATTPIDPRVMEEMARVALQIYGNPSSLHRKGREGERVLTTSRKVLADFLGVRDSEIIFTSGGTESNNLAILGIARRYLRRGKHLITTAIEHPSVLQPFQLLEKEGFEVTYLTPDSRGVIAPQDLLKALKPETIFVSIMHVNNEVGSIQPIQEISGILKREKPEIIFHVDAVQSFGKVTLPPGLQGIDALSISAHKLHGPKGTGALYLKSGIMIEPLLLGGGHERGLRAGTENTPGIAGMALAARYSFVEINKKAAQLRQMKKQFISDLQTRHPWIRINGPGVDEKESAPHIVNISFPGLKGEIIVHALEEQGIYASTGSACHSNSKGESHVLQAMKLGRAEMEGAVRFSFSARTTQEEITRAVQRINEVISGLKQLTEKMAGV
ncbi:MAG: cysteine desulfurase [Firmicutes bacterium]|nr:cysteine desulfurase [Bacillota bacterium]